MTNSLRISRSKSCLYALCVCVFSTIARAESDDFDLSSELALSLDPKYPRLNEPFAAIVTHQQCRYALSDAEMSIDESSQTGTITFNATDLGEPCTTREVQFMLPHPGLGLPVVVDIFVNFSTQGLVNQGGTIFYIGSIFLIDDALDVSLDPAIPESKAPFDIVVSFNPPRAFDLQDPTVSLEDSILTVGFTGVALVGAANAPQTFRIPYEGLPGGRYELAIEVEYESEGTVPQLSIEFGTREDAVAIPAWSVINSILLALTVA